MNKLILQKKNKKRGKSIFIFPFTEATSCRQGDREGSGSVNTNPRRIASSPSGSVSCHRFRILLSCSTYFVVLPACLPACLPAYTPVSIQTLKGDRNLPRQEKRGRAKGKKLSAENKISICTSTESNFSFPSSIWFKEFEICQVVFTCGFSPGLRTQLVQWKNSDYLLFR